MLYLVRKIWTSPRSHVAKCGAYKKLSCIINIPFTVTLTDVWTLPSRFSAVQLYTPRSSNWIFVISRLRCCKCLLSSSITSPSLYHVITGGGNPVALHGNVTFCSSFTTTEEEGFAMKRGNSRKGILFVDTLLNLFLDCTGQSNYVVQSMFEFLSRANSDNHTHQRTCLFYFVKTLHLDFNRSFSRDVIRY